MADYNDMMIATGNEDAEDDQVYYASMQAVINAGSIWCMEGSAGRSAMEALKGGRCILGVNACHDYYKNRIPSRTDIKAGSFGSELFVRECMGDEWADAMVAVK